MQEKPGVPAPNPLNLELAEKLLARRKSVSSSDLVAGILSHNQTALSRAITMIESTAAKHKELAREIITACLPHAHNSIRIGITGVPGVGKSTFIESFGKLLISKGKKVAVLTVDPSSSISKGSILGDKTRMEELVKEENAFIRPSASGDTLGGVARKTRETIILCEAAGFDVILIETVGVGQSETTVHSMTDFFLLLKLAGAGDELQGIKRGIMEMADAIVINKAEKENANAANLAIRELQSSLQMFPVKESGWKTKVEKISALEKMNIDKVWTLVEKYIQLTQENNFFVKNRNQQNLSWFKRSSVQMMFSYLRTNPGYLEREKLLSALVEQGKISPFIASEKLFENLEMVMK